MNIELSWAPVLEFFTQPVSAAFGDAFSVIGWPIFTFFLVYLAIHYYQELRGDRYTADWQWVLLAVDIPQENVQTPKAVEQMFSHLAGAFEGPNLAEKFHEGVKQRTFSFEIISIEGYIQFLVYTEQKFQDLVETAIYAQYPEAEIVEVEDYTKDIPSNYPNETHDMWAADFALAQKDAYPIRSYRDFEHSISKDTVLKDPMGTLLESFSRIGVGEQMWLQIIVEPISNSWKEKVIDEVKKLIGEKVKSKKDVFDHVTGSFQKSLEFTGDQLFGREASSGSGDDGGKEEQNKLKYLTPGQSGLVEAMEMKIAKIGFKTKMRAVYLARKEVFRPSRGVHALIGAVNQFNIPTANSLVPAFGVSASYFFKKQRVKYRKELMMKAYKKRKHKVGASPYVLNIEELATIWHFPMSHVKTPLLQKAEGKKVEPPTGLPTEALPGIEFAQTPELVEKTPPPATYKTDAGEVVERDGIRFG